MVYTMHFQPYNLTYSISQRIENRNTLKQDQVIPYSLQQNEAIPYSLDQNEAIPYSLDQNEAIPYSLDKGKSSTLYEKIAGEIPGAEMNLAEKRVIEQLKARDAEVRAHEHAHMAAAGGVATSGPNYVYVRGPDGRLYAVGGEVSITSAPVPGNPEKTIEKAKKIRRAALAPANPSPQDMRVAAAATRLERQARSELTREKAAEKAEEVKEEDELQARNRQEDILHPRIEDIYTKEAAGITENSNQYVDILI